VDQLAARPAERFDPDGCKSPEGEWRPGKRQAGLGVKAATGASEEAAETGANREVGGGAKSRTGRGSGWLEAKRQAGSVDPGMETVKAGFVAGERKVGASIRSRAEERLRRAWKR
jgi:hypothetical protein